MATGMKGGGISKRKLSLEIELDYTSSGGAAPPTPAPPQFLLVIARLRNGGRVQMQALKMEIVTISENHQCKRLWRKRKVIKMKEKRKRKQDKERNLGSDEYGNKKK
jgi:hypothetical protein